MAEGVLCGIIPLEVLSHFLVFIAENEAHLLGLCRSVCRSWLEETEKCTKLVFVQPLVERCAQLSQLSQFAVCKKKMRTEFLDATLALIAAWDAPVLGHIKLWRLLCLELR